MPAKNKPKKPYPDYPLFPHLSGQWSKKIKGKNFYFGAWADPEAAVNLYNQVREYLHQHRTWPPSDFFREGISLADICNYFLDSKELAMDNDRLSFRSYADYRATCERIVKILGRDRPAASIGPADFTLMRAKLEEKLNNRSTGNEIGRIRMVFKFAVDNGYLDRLPRYGQDFERPSKATIRRERLSKPKQLFTPVQLRKLIKYANQPLQAMILLGLNGGMGNSDIARMRYDHVDLSSGWLDYPRHKTAVERRFPLWPETKKALEKAIECRPEGGNPEEIFCTVKGKSWFKEESSDTPISKEFRKLCVDCKIHTKGVGFYALRHCFETFASEVSTDQIAINAIMAHVDQSMAAEYRESISDERLQAVVDGVRKHVLVKSKK